MGGLIPKIDMLGGRKQYGRNLEDTMAVTKALYILLLEASNYPVGLWTWHDLWHNQFVCVISYSILSRDYAKYAKTFELIILKDIKMFLSIFLIAVMAFGGSLYIALIAAGALDEDFS